MSVAIVETCHFCPNVATNKSTIEDEGTVPVCDRCDEEIGCQCDKPHCSVCGSHLSYGGCYHCDRPQ